MRVLATGTFDNLHKGHTYFLKEAKKLGDELFVIVARSSNVEKIKGKKTKYTDKERVNKVKALNFVDEAMLGDKTDPLKLVTNVIKPDIIALGYDQVAFTDNLATILKKKGLNNVIIRRIGSFKPEIYKSSKL